MAHINEKRMKICPTCGNRFMDKSGSQKDCPSCDMMSQEYMISPNEDHITMMRHLNKKKGKK